MILYRVAVERPPVGLSRPHEPRQLGGEQQQQRGQDDERDGHWRVLLEGVTDEATKRGAAPPIWPAVLS
jgi:hypothetical protein